MENTEKIEIKISELNELINKKEKIDKKFDIPLKIFGVLSLLCMPVAFFSVAALIGLPLNLIIIVLMANIKERDMKKLKEMIENKGKEIEEISEQSMADVKEIENSNDFDQKLEAIGIYEVYREELLRKYSISLDCLLIFLKQFGLSDSQIDMVVCMVKEDVRTEGEFAKEIESHMLIFKRPENARKTN